MSLSLSRASRTRVGILALGPLLVALGGCHRRTSALDQPSPTERVQSRRSQPSNDELLPRRFPGVDVIPTRRGGFFIRIHSGLVGAGEPLYVIDDAPVMVEPNRGIDWVKLEDVVQIRVVKAPTENAVLAPRGVNRVVMI
jgi:hypothetical protein